MSRRLMMAFPVVLVLALAGIGVHHHRAVGASPKGAATTVNSLNDKMSELNLTSEAAVRPSPSGSFSFIPPAEAALKGGSLQDPKQEGDTKKGGEPEYSQITYTGPPIKSRSEENHLLTVAPSLVNGVDQGMEVEPNDTPATATPLTGTNVKIKGNLFPSTDLVDYYSFTGNAGDRVYAAIETSFSASSSDSQLTLFNTNGVTQIEFDDDNGSFAGFSSSIAGAVLPTTGTYFLKVNNFTAGTTIRPYDLYLRVQSGAPTPEVESNDTPATANVLPANGWVSGTRNPGTDVDFYSMTLNAGDTVFLSLDGDPERDSVFWNPRLGFALFGTALNQILVVDDATTPSAADPNSEAMFFTVKTAGTYYAYVDQVTATGGATFTYHLSVSVFPQTPTGCMTFTSADVPKTIGPAAGTTTSTLTIPGNIRISKLRVAINLDHANMPDLDVTLTAPDGNVVGLFTDIGAAAQTHMDLILDDNAGIPVGAFTIASPVIYQPELAYRLGWFKGQQAGGTWTLTLRDDTTNASGGTLNGWSLIVCPDPGPAACVGGTPTTVFSTDFEANNGGFTHSGTQDEWQYGTPAFAPITTANSGTKCWKTDLTGTYNASSNQDLFSPNISLTGLAGPVQFSWAMKYQMESATFDHIIVEVQEVGGGGAIQRVYDWLDATMTDSQGNPATTINEAAGWGIYRADITSFVGKTIRLRFHLDSDTTGQFAGLAIDDVAVTACTPTACVVTCPANITKSNDPNQCGAVVTYPPPTLGINCGTLIGCSPASGSFFPVGTTTVTCTTTAGGSCMFTVKVNDTQPPVITCPANITTAATSTGGAVVNFTTTASDNCPGVTVLCVPPSGSTFPVGTTTVNCTASDTAAPPNTASCSFTVTVTGLQLSILFVADTMNHRVQKFDGLVWSLVGTGVPGSGPGQFKAPEAVTADITGMKIYVADTGNRRIQYSTDGGNTWMDFAIFGSALKPGGNNWGNLATVSPNLSQVNSPQGLALDAAGNLYVSDTGNNRVLRFNGGVPGTAVLLASTGAAVGSVNSPRGLAIDLNNTLYIADFGNNRIQALAAANGAGPVFAATVIAGTGTVLNPAQVRGAEGVGVDNAGNLYVADTGNNRVLMFAAPVVPGVATLLCDSGSVLGQARSPEGVTVTSFTQGVLLGAALCVGDTGNNRIEGSLTPTVPASYVQVGAPLGGAGSFTGQFRSPSKIR